MAELKFEEYQLPAEIRFNFEELKTELTEKVKTYKNMVYTENDIKAAKADRADLNRQKKALNDERLTRQKEYMKPFDAFKKQVDEVIAIIDDAVKNIDVQVKEFEAKQKEEKERAIREKFAELNNIEWLKCEQVFDTKWLNASASMNSIAEDMNVILTAVKTNIASLKGLEYEFEATERYKATLSLAEALNENKRLIDLAAKKAEMERQKAEEAKKKEWEENLVPMPGAEKLADWKKEVEEQAAEEPKTWLTLEVLVDEAEYDALVEWLDEHKIERNIT